MSNESLTMKLKRISGVALLLALGICSSVEAQPAAGVAPQNRSLTIQVWDATTWKAGRSKTTVEAPVHRCFIRSVRGSPADRSFLSGLVVSGHDSRTVQLCLDDQALARKKVPPPVLQ